MEFNRLGILDYKIVYIKYCAYDEVRQNMTKMSVAAVKMQCFDEKNDRSQLAYPHKCIQRQSEEISSDQFDWS